MNIELRPRLEAMPTFLPMPAKADPANDNRTARDRPSAPRALIYRPAQSAMTSGRAGTKRWVLEFEPQAASFIEPLMGWTGSTDPLVQVRISFPSREAAVAYAERRGLDYEVREPPGARDRDIGRPMVLDALSPFCSFAVMPARMSTEAHNRRLAG